VYVVAGTINGLALTPNDTSTPPSTAYKATFANGDVWICQVPSSSTPVAFTAACAPNPTPPNSPVPVPPSQIIASPVNNTVLSTINGIVQWTGAPGAPNTILTHAYGGAGSFTFTHNLNTLTPIVQCYLAGVISPVTVASATVNTTAVAAPGAGSYTCVFNASGITGPAQTIQNVSGVPCGAGQSVYNATITGTTLVFSCR
jgi:hypothetical protein